MHSSEKNIPADSQKYVYSSDRCIDKPDCIQTKTFDNPYSELCNPPQCVSPINNIKVNKPKDDNKQNNYDAFLQEPQLALQKKIQSDNEHKNFIKRPSTDSIFKKEFNMYMNQEPQKKQSKLQNFFQEMLGSNLSEEKQGEVENANVHHQKKGHRASIEHLVRTKTTEESADLPKPQFTELQSPSILVEPFNCLQFVCTPFQTSAVMKIFIDESANPSSVFHFNIRATNKQDYRVSEPVGQLRATQTKVIYFYLKQSASVNGNLKDKFLLQIKTKNRFGIEKKVYSKKFTILIQSALHSKNPNDVTPFSNPNFPIGNASMSKFMPVYMSAMGGVQDAHENRSHLPLAKSQVITPFQSSINSSRNKVGHSSSIKLNAIKEEIRMRAFKSKVTVFNSLPPMSDIGQLAKLTNEKDPNIQNILTHPEKATASLANTLSTNLSQYDPNIVQKIHTYQQDLKTELNETMQDIEKMKRKVLLIQNENKSIKARARFRIYATVISIVIAFFLGIFVKQLHVRERTEKSYEHIKEKIEELWYSRRDAGSDLKSMASSLPSSQNINNPSNI